MRTLFAAKVFCYFSILSILYFVYMSITEYKSQPYLSAPTYTVIQQWIKNIANSSKANMSGYNDKAVMKYILQWTSPRFPFVQIGEGEKEFIRRNCPHTNCIVTSNRSLLGSITKFDVIAFSVQELRLYNKTMLPDTRSPHQKYVFVTMESSQYYPVCTDQFDNYFNWTWTFRLDSDVRCGYISISDTNNNIIGPNKIMHWIKHDEMDPVSEEFKNKLKTKKKAAAWFVSNCNDKIKRRIFANALRLALRQYNLTLDMYGSCGPLKCPSPQIKDCEKMLKNDYYFYLSFENSFSEDYVTEKFLKAMVNDVVPIVYGGANYTRFAPDGAYINATPMSASELAAKIAELIKKPEQYAEYFRWKNHYSYHAPAEDSQTDPLCHFCAITNDEEKIKKTTYIKDLRKWWNNPNFC